MFYGVIIIILADATQISLDAALKAVNLSIAEESSYMYFLNDGLYGSFNCLFYDHAEVKPLLLKVCGESLFEKLEVVLDQ